MVDPVAPVASGGVQSSVTAFEGAVRNLVASTMPTTDAPTADAPIADARLSDLPAAKLVHATPEVDAEGRPLKDYPAAYVFAPGFLHADRRGIVAYPGLEISNPIIEVMLTQRYAQANLVAYRQAQTLYDEVLKLRAKDDAAAS